MMTTVKVDYIKDSHNNGKIYFDTEKKFENWTKNTKYMGKCVKHIKIAKNLIGSLTAMVVFFKRREI